MDKIYSNSSEKELKTLLIKTISSENSPEKTPTKHEIKEQGSGIKGQGSTQVPNKPERSLSEPLLGDSQKKSCEAELKKIKFDRKELFRKRDKSRFTFVNNEEKNIEENIAIPEFIHEILYNKISKLAFFKIFNFEDQADNSESMLKDVKNNNPWAQFLLNNKQAVNNQK